MVPELEALRAAALHQLEARSVFDINAYGWLNADDVDPDFVGYAMWTLTPPYEHDFDHLLGERTAQTPPTDAQQRLLEWGHDFYGLMKVTRHFIGLALLTRSPAEDISAEPTEFDANEFAALVSLVSATDRLRDFIIVTIFGQKNEDREGFNDAVMAIRQAGLTRDADRLNRWPDAIRRVRKARNTAAHGLATTPARVQRQLFEINKDNGQGPQMTGDGAVTSARRRFAGIPDERRDAIEERMTLLCNCYRELVQMGNACFQAEYAWRNREAAAPTSG